MCFDYEIPEKQKIKNRKLEEEETMEVEPELEKEERPLMASA